MKRLICTLSLLTGLAGPVMAEPVTADRIATLPADQQPAWRAYVDRSQADARADQAALDAELAALSLAQPLPAPNGDDFALPAKPGEPFYKTPEAATLVDVVLSYQTPSGGWSKHTAYRDGPRKPGMLFSSQYKPGARPHYLATYDNGSTTTQLLFLAYAWQATQRDDCAAAFVKGIDFVLRSQYPTGGWPQVYPLEGGYHDEITFNDDANTRILTMLKAIADKDPAFAFIDADRRAKVESALAAGIDCVLRAQSEHAGSKSVWCAQHDPFTLKPAGARAFEPAALSGMESVRVVQFLMSIDRPSPAIVASIEGALAWFDRVKITGIRQTTRDGLKVFEVDPTSTQLYWARFYDIETSKPIFPGRDRVQHETFAEMAAGKGTGYSYYTTRPDKLLNSDQPKWREKLKAPTTPTTR